MRVIISIGIVEVLAFLLFTAGCSGAGFGKKATLMPDSLGISLMQERFRGDNAAWRGVSINMT